ncbi:MAG: class I SAM-dependent methyltransferase [Patescibacteria group bacterium]
MLKRMVGDVAGHTVLDLGCGDGYFTRYLKTWGAQTAVGIDISTALIDLARKQEVLLPQGVTYHVGDMRTARLCQQFDVVSSVYALNYSASKKDLHEACLTIREHLKSKGRFVAIIPHPDILISNIFRYGNHVTSLSGRTTNLQDGEILRCHHKKFDGTIYGFDFYYWSAQAYKNSILAAGMEISYWLKPFVSEEGIQKYGKPYWDGYLASPSALGLVCRKR